MTRQAGDPYVRNAVVLEIIDADTVLLDVDLGYFVHEHVPHRLFGINAPEKRTAAGKAAIAFLNDVMPKGTKVIVRSTKAKQDGMASDKYGGRFLAHLYIAQSGLYVNEHLVDSGFAFAWDGKGEKPTS
jgi:endonuclease YncB( thermonuclease family)